MAAKLLILPCKVALIFVGQQIDDLKRDAGRRSPGCGAAAFGGQRMSFCKGLELCREPGIAGRQGAIKHEAVDRKIEMNLERFVRRVASSCASRFCSVDARRCHLPLELSVASL